MWLWCSKGDFHFLHSFYILKLEFFSEIELSLLPYLFTSIWKSGYWFYSMGYLIYFFAHIVPALAISSSFRLAPASYQSTFFWDFLTFWHHKVLQIHFILSQPQPWKQPLLQGALVPFIGEVLFYQGCTSM